MAHAMDGDSILAYVCESLLPVLSAGNVVVMDDLSSHTLVQVRELIESRGAKLAYLQAYSPDFNPIEMIGSKVKRLLYSLAARTIEQVHQAFARVYAAVTPEDIRNCFTHCGYKL